MLPLYHAHKLLVINNKGFKECATDKHLFFPLIFFYGKNIFAL